MTRVLAGLFQYIYKSSISLVQFLLIIVMGIWAGIAWILPWLLRLLCLGIFIAGIYTGLDTIQVVYSNFSPTFPIIALQFALTLGAIGSIMFMLQHKANYLWGSSLLIGSLLLAASYAANSLPVQNKSVLFFFQALPPALMTTLWLYEALRLRKIFKSRRSTANLSNGNDRHESDEIQSEGRTLQPAEP